MAKDLSLQVRLQAIDKITSPLKKITKGSGKTAEAIRASKDQLRDLNKQQKDVSAYRQTRWAMRGNQRTIDEMTEKQKEYSKALEGQRERHVNIKASLTSTRRQYDKLAKQVAQATEPNKQLSGELEKARIALTSQQQAFDKSSRAIKTYRDRSRHAEDQVKNLNRAQQGHQDRLSGIKRSLDEAGVSTEDMTRAARDLRTQEERLNETLERQKKRLERIKDVRERLSGIRSRGGAVLNNGRSLAAGAGIAGGVATAAVGGLGHNFASSGEEVRQWSARLGIATEQLSRLQYAGSQFGVQNDAMTDALKELSLRTDEFTSTGKGPGAEAFTRLGLSPEQLEAASNDTGELFSMVLGQLREVENVAARQRIVDELFGGQGGEQLAEFAGASADEIRRLVNEADELGVTLGDQDTKAAQEYMRAWRGATGALKGVRNILGRELAPELAGLFKKFSSWVKTNRDQVQQFAKDFRSGLRDVLPLIVESAKGLAEFARTSAIIVQRVAEMVGGFDNLAIIMSALFASKTIGSVLSLVTAIGGLAGGGKAMEGLGKSMKWTGRQAKGPLISALKGVWKTVSGVTLGLRAFGDILWAVGKGMTQSMAGALKKLAKGGFRAIGQAANWMGSAVRTVSIHAHALATRALPMLGNALVSLGKGFVTLASAIGRAGVALLANPMTWIILGIVAAVAALAAAAYLIYKNWGAISGWFAQRWADVKAAFNDGIGGIGRLLLNWNPVGLLYRGITAALSALGVEIPAKFKTLGGFIVDGLIGGLTGKLGQLKDQVVGLASSIGGWFKDKLGINSPSRVFSGFGANLLEGLTGKLAALKDKVTGIANSVKGWFAGVLDMHSPSRVFAKFGGYTIDGLNQGLDAKRDEPARRIAQIAKSVTRAGAGMALGAATLPAAAAMPDAAAIPAAAAMPIANDVPIDTRTPLQSPGGGAASTFKEASISRSMPAPAWTNRPSPGTSVPRSSAPWQMPAAMPPRVSARHSTISTEP